MNHITEYATPQLLAALGPLVEVTLLPHPSIRDTFVASGNLPTVGLGRKSWPNWKRWALAALCLMLALLLASCADGAGNAPTVPDAGPVAPRQGQDAQASQTPDGGPAIVLPDARVVEPDSMPPDSYVVMAAPDTQLLAAPADAQPAGTPDAGTFPACDIRTIPRQCVAYFGPPPCVWLDSPVSCRSIEMNCSNGVVCGISRIVVSNCDLCRLLVGP